MYNTGFYHSKEFSLRQLFQIINKKNKKQKNRIDTPQCCHLINVYFFHFNTASPLYNDYDII